MKINVVIVILNWNGWRDTLECLKSLEYLTFRNFHTIVVDNCSVDDSVNKIQTTFPNVEILPLSQNFGFSSGNNAGIQVALQMNADFVWLLNNDTIVDPEALSELYKTAISDVSFGAVGCQLRYLNRPECIQAWGGGMINFLSGMNWHHLSPVPRSSLQYLTAASLLVSQTALKAVQGLDEGFFMYWEDVDLSFRIRKAGFQLVVADNAIVLHRESASSSKNIGKRDYMFNYSSARFMRRHSTFFPLPILISVCKRLIFRLLRMDLNRAIAVVNGTIDGLRVSQKIRISSWLDSYESQK